MVGRRKKIAPKMIVYITIRYGTKQGAAAAKPR
jgi:hypothetical protein